MESVPSSLLSLNIDLHPECFDARLEDEDDDTDGAQRIERVKSEPLVFFEVLLADPHPEFNRVILWYVREHLDGDPLWKIPHQM